MNKTKKLIKELKEEIEKINKKETITQTDLSNYNLKRAQLQFAEKLIKAIKEDVEKIRQHTLVCMKFLSKIRMPEEVKDMIKYHHERYDGFGYPEGLKGDEIPLGARVIAVAEAFETMTGEDSYKKTLTVKEAIEELRRNAGDQFDPELVVALESVLKERMKKEYGKNSGKE